MIKIRFIIFRLKGEKINYKLINILKKYKIRFTFLNFGKCLKSKKIKIINYKSKELKELFIRILNFKEDVCFFLNNSFDAYKDISFLIKKTKWYFAKYTYNAGILDFNLNCSKYFYFKDNINYNINKFYGLDNIKCPDPRCFAFKKDLLSNFIDFKISTKNFGRGFEVFMSFFCYYSNNKSICRDFSKKINIKNTLGNFRTLLDISKDNQKYDKKLNVYMETISSNTFFNMEYENKVYFNKGPNILLKIINPIINKNSINKVEKNNDFVFNDNTEILKETKLYES